MRHKELENLLDIEICKHILVIRRIILLIINHLKDTVFPKVLFLRIKCPQEMLFSHLCWYLELRICESSLCVQSLLSPWFLYDRLRSAHAVDL